MIDFNHFVNFITNHWMLSGGFLFVLLGLMVNEFIQRQMGLQEVSPEQAVRLMNHEDAVLFDTRSPAAFSQGHILGALSVAPALIEKDKARYQKYTGVPVIVVCAVGQSAKSFGAELQKMGFSRVLVLAGGMQNWNALGLPVVKS